MVINQQSLQGLNVAYSTAFNKAFEGVQPRYQKVASVVPSTTASTNYNWLGQFPQMREWIGEREIQSLSAYDYVIRNKKFEMSVAVPRDAVEDDMYGIYNAMFGNLGDAAAQHPNNLVFDIMKNGFKKKCYDEKTFFATDHPSGKDGETETSNCTTEKLSMDSYIEARASMMGLIGDKGKSLNIVPDLLVVSPSNEREGRLILEADFINGTSNTMKGTAKLLVATELADEPDQWFLLCTNKFLKPFIYQERQKIRLTALIKDTDENVFMRDEYIWGADGRSNAGYGFWQMAYGSTGTTSSKG